MTSEESARILGPELAQQADDLAAALGPLTPEQIKAVARILEPVIVAETPASRDVA